MNFLKRAIVSIQRRPGKTVILMLLVFILGNIISGAISVQQAVQNTEENLRRNLPAVATLEQDTAALMEHENRTGEWVEVERLTSDLIRQIGELQYVESFDFSATARVFSSEVERVSHPDPEFEFADWERLEVEGLYQFVLQGVHNPEVLDIQAELINLVAGRVFTEQEMSNFNGINSVALVSRDFAELNNLTVGSTFILDNTIYDDINIEGAWIESEIYTEDNVIARESYEFEIIGIFEQATTFDSDDEWENVRRELQLANRIYVPNAVAESAMNFMFEQWLEIGRDDMEIGRDDDDSEVSVEDWLWFEPVYVLNNPTELTAFATAAEELLPDFWRVADLSNTFADIASSMETMQTLASIVLWVSVVATLLILSLLITLFLRDRKHEIGIYLALGEKKMKVISQILLEVTTVSIVAITLSLFSGSLLASNISESMLRQNLINQQQDNMWGGSVVWSSSTETLGWFSSGDMTTEEMLESYDLSLDATTVVMFYGIGIGAILVSTVAPIVYIMRLDPKKIMM